MNDRKWQKFKNIKRGYWSFIFLTALTFLSFGAELISNHRAILVYYKGTLFFPTYGGIIPGRMFDQDYDFETDYRKLKLEFSQKNEGNFVIMPLVPFGPFENDLKEGSYPPYPPSFADRHFLGTDHVGRDIVARLFYGYRIAMMFSLALLVVSFGLGILVGCMMGYFGGIFDLIFQRLIEIWSNIPVIYVIMIVASFVSPNFTTLILITSAFSWINMTWYLRTVTYKEKEREYILAGKALGFSDFRLICRHILPNAMSLMITFIPFLISNGIIGLTSLDYLGFGLPPPTPSWGDLLAQGVGNLSYTWIVTSVVASIVFILTMVTFVGEAIREAYDPKKFILYR